LLGLAALGLAGCKAGSSASATHTDPDRSALAVARSAEQVLVAACDAAGLTAESAIHAEHLAALGGSVPVPRALNTPAAHAIRALLRDSTDSLRGAALAAVSGAHAAVFASVAASHEVMTHD
jgi:hypothetical protein